MLTTAKHLKYSIIGEWLYKLCYTLELEFILQLLLLTMVMWMMFTDMKNSAVNCQVKEVV